MYGFVCVYIYSDCWGGAVCVQRRGVKSCNLSDRRDEYEQLLRRENRQQLVWFYIDVAIIGGAAGGFLLEPILHHISVFFPLSRGTDMMDHAPKIHKQIEPLFHIPY